MSESGSDRRSNLRSATEVPVQTRTLITRECTAALRSAEKYCLEQMDTKLPALRRELAANVKGTLDDALSNFQELIHTSVRDKLAAFQQQVYTRIDEKMTAIKQEINHLKGENAHLQEQLTLREAQDLSKTNLIPAITALQGEVASLKLKLSTVSKTEATAARTATPASQPMPAASRGENTALSADNAPVPCVMQETASIPINPEGLARELDAATLLKAGFNIPTGNAAQPSAAASNN